MKFVVVDFETIENGMGSTEFYRRDFRVASAAFSWLSESDTIRSHYVEGEDGVGTYLRDLVRKKVPLVAHNVPFEMGVIQCRYNDVSVESIWYADTMRLAQVFDNGGDKFALEAPLSLDDQLDAIEGSDDDDVKLESTAGLGLVKCIRRILRRPNHKLEAHQWLRENVPECKKGKEGAFLHRLPSDLIERYNVGDTEETLRLYQFLTDYFEKIRYDWRLDHQLYFSSVRLIVDSQIRGVPVDRVSLENYRRELQQEIVDIGCLFRTTFHNEILIVERSRLLVEVQKRKTLRGRKNFVRNCRSSPQAFRKHILFNVGSNKQLEALFCNQLEIRPKFLTRKGAPSFRSSVLSQWGKGGELLKRRRKRLLVLKQTESLLELSEYDGRWHVSLKAAGTSTGRFSGGSHG